MTDFPSTHTDLLDLPVATLATIAGDGTPQLTEVWFLHADGELKLSLNTHRRKTKNLRARSECALFLLDLGNPYRYMSVRGHARIDPDDDYTFADRLGAKYGTTDFYKHDAEDERRVVVTIEPTSVYAVDMNA
jgi:PPOX class probable F420-dependent enzyme